MTLFVDTSVWSLAFRRDALSDAREVIALRLALQQGQSIVSTGLVLQEILQGFVGAKAQQDLIRHFAALPFINPSRKDHIDAAELRNHCRRNSVQLGTVDALIAQLCIRNNVVLLSTDADFKQAARHCPLLNWAAP